jgi:hypothetical protein
MYIDYLGVFFIDNMDSHAAKRLDNSKFKISVRYRPYDYSYRTVRVEDRVAFEIQI